MCLKIIGKASVEKRGQTLLFSAKIIDKSVQYLGYNMVKLFPYEKLLANVCIFLLTQENDRFLLKHREQTKQEEFLYLYLGF